MGFFSVRRKWEGSSEKKNHYTLYNLKAGRGMSSTKGMIGGLGVKGKHFSKGGLLDSKSALKPYVLLQNSKGRTSVRFPEI